MTASLRPPLRVGSVSFLNARPLVRHLELAGPPAIELSLEIPSRLSELIRKNDLDVALLPSIEFLREPAYRILPHVCIASDGPVESVRVFSKVPLNEIATLALDVSSRTSAALIQVLLKRKYGVLPALSESSPHDDLWQRKEDAMLLIGDPAMKRAESRDVSILDLGEEWKKQTGLPFVYALWVARDTVELANLPTRLLEARDKGLADLEQISAEAAAEIGLSTSICTHYLRDVIRYHFGKRELEGLSLFQKLAAEDGLCSGGIDIAASAA